MARERKVFVAVSYWCNDVEIITVDTDGDKVAQAATDHRAANPCNDCWTVQEWTSGELTYEWTAYRE